jgi:hypothetical protein
MDRVITQGGAHFERFANLIDSQCPRGRMGRTNAIAIGPPDADFNLRSHTMKRRLPTWSPINSRSFSPASLTLLVRPRKGR